MIVIIKAVIKNRKENCTIVPFQCQKEQKRGKQEKKRKVGKKGRKIKRKKRIRTKIKDVVVNGHRGRARWKLNAKDLEKIRRLREVIKSAHVKKKVLRVVVVNIR